MSGRVESMIGVSRIFFTRRVLAASVNAKSSESEPDLDSDAGADMRSFAGLQLSSCF